ncbi:MAG: hypothetical protein [Wendovervirus sonii]|uniref:Uncharacterized protein n=1 Tax=phage Lak_Megaphage_Sonny TaxID=3109229 RepID=A0ABZ0Z3K3_9CAUD|nr:MAG: hypothetical protein [phage Lak_Megaphage_Sonny]
MNTDNIPYHIFWNNKVKGCVFKNISESTDNFDDCTYIGTSNPPEITSDDIINKHWQKIIKNG